MGKSERASACVAGTCFVSGKSGSRVPVSHETFQEMRSAKLRSVGKDVWELNVCKRHVKERFEGAGLERED